VRQQAWVYFDALVSARLAIETRQRTDMPFYEYECKQCGHALEAMQKINDAPLKKCPECGKAALQRLMSAPVFRLKGAGWYETDFKSDQEGKRNLADRPETEAPADDKKDAKDPAAKDAAGKDASAAPHTEAKSADAGTASAGASGDKSAAAPGKKASSAPGSHKGATSASGSHKGAASASGSQKGAASASGSRVMHKTPARPAATSKAKTRKPAKPVKKAKPRR
jgi:putative FmdB family regulatory protein